MCAQLNALPHSLRFASNQPCTNIAAIRGPFTWLGGRVVSMLDSGGVRFKSQPRRCRVTVLDKLFTPIVPLFTKQRN